MDAIHIDERFLPLYFVRFEGTPTLEQFEEYLANVERTMYAPTAGQRIILLDSADATPITPTQRKLQGEWQKKHYERIQLLTIGVAFVIPSAVIRGILTAIFWIQTLPCPHSVFATRADALDWCEMRMRARNLSLPVGTRAGLCGANGRNELRPG